MRYIRQNKKRMSGSLVYMGTAGSPDELAFIRVNWETIDPENTRNGKIK